MKLVHNDIILIPYVEYDGSRSVSDRMAKAFWEKAITQGLDRKTYGKDTSPDDFVRIIKSPTNYPVFIFIRGDEEPSGVAYLNGLAGNHSFAHFCFLKETWGRRTVEMGEALCLYWFSLCDGQIDVLVGNIPSSNQKAVHFVKRLGWKVVGEIPYMAQDGAATILYTTHEDWR